MPSGPIRAGKASASTTAGSFGARRSKPVRAAEEEQSPRRMRVCAAAPLEDLLKPDLPDRLRPKDRFWFDMGGPPTKKVTSIDFF